MQTVHMAETKTIPAQWQIYLMFYIYALTMGSLYPRLADLQIKMHLGEAALGFSLLGLALGTQISLLFAASALTASPARFTRFLEYSGLIVNFIHLSKWA